MFTTRPKPRLSMPSHAALHMLKQPPRLVSSTSSQPFRAIFTHRAVAGDAGIVDDDVDGTEIGQRPWPRPSGTPRNPRRSTCRRDAGLVGKTLGAIVVAHVVRGDLVSRVLQRHRNPLRRCPRVPPVTIATRAMYALPLIFFDPTLEQVPGSRLAVFDPHRRNRAIRIYRLGGGRHLSRPDDRARRVIFRPIRASLSGHF